MAVNTMLLIINIMLGFSFLIVLDSTSKNESQSEPTKLNGQRMEKSAYKPSDHQARAYLWFL